MVAGGALVISDDVMIVESFAVMVVLSFDESLLWFWTVQGLSGSHVVMQQGQQKAYLEGQMVTYII